MTANQVKFYLYFYIRLLKVFNRKKCYEKFEINLSIKDLNF